VSGSSNPFNTSQSPVRPEIFSGRPAMLVEILGGLQRPPNCNFSIVGSSLSGRTSLLRYLVSEHAKRKHPELEKVWPVLFEAIAGMELSTEIFWSRIFAETLKICDDDDVRSVIEETLESRKFGLTDLQQVVDPIGECGHLLLVVIDDFDRIIGHERFGILTNITFYEQLRNLCLRAPHPFGMIVASPKLLHDYRPGSSGASGYPNVFKTKRLEPLDKKSTKSVIDSHLRDSSISFTEVDATEIWRLSAGLPAFVQIHAAAMYNGHLASMAQKRRIDFIEKEAEDENGMHVQFVRHLVGNMTLIERTAFDALLQGKALELDAIQILRELHKRGGLPPGVEVP